MLIFDLANYRRKYFFKWKTDSFGRGCDVKLRSKGMMVCPVQALTSLLSSPVGHGALFFCQDGLPLTKEDFISLVRAALLKAGLNPNLFAGHSGAATTATAAGVHDIKHLGGWSSDAYQLFVRVDSELLVAGIVTTLAECLSS